MSTTIERNCDATLYVAVEADKIPNVDAAMALEGEVISQIADNSRFFLENIDVTLDEYDPPSGTDSGSACYVVNISGTEDVRVYSGCAGSYCISPESAEIDAEDGVAKELLYDAKLAFEALGHKVVDGDVEEDRSDTVEELYESLGG